MSKTILIDASNAEQTRIAVTVNHKLDDFEIESNKKNSVKGDVYLAKITRVEPSLQAAFVEFGANRNGFLPLTEIHPDYFKIPSADKEEVTKLYDKLSENNNDAEDNEKPLSKDQDDVTNEENIENENENENKRIKIINPKKNYINFFRKYKIQDVIKPRQVILVQVNKEERGLKGAALTTFLSFAGRYCVLMPNSLNNDGISRKIGDAEERKKLKQIITSVNIPEKMSVIVRTAGIGKTKKEIAKDLSFLISQWNKIRQLTIKSEAPELIYEEGNILKRTIRDMLTEDVESILVEGKEAFDKIKKLSKNLTPGQTKKVKIHKNNEKSLFADHNIENQINDLFSLTVKLPSGGSIVINTTEALVAIDVNSGKNTTERNIENTALKTNMEAAVEIARQLRLRDLGGLVVIDFIDMDDYRNNFKVEKAIKSALYKDRARIQVGRISMFGLLELSRQRLRSSLIDKTFDKCPYCNGSGLILNSKAISEQIINVIKEKISEKQNINVKCNTSLAETLINNKNKEVTELENIYNSKITFTFDNHFSLHEPLVEIQGKITNIDNEDSVKRKNKTKKKIVTKVTKVTKVSKVSKVKKKSETKKNHSIKETGKIKYIKKDINDNKVIKGKDDKISVEETSVTKNEGSKADDKTGWWS
ncbi:Rne/Rng family ribonuclease [Alphaproteobacteria bacterium]|nr:Rne/Rng family ribonuclease [Alphaproteobacteria bacterium]